MERIAPYGGKYGYFKSAYGGYAPHARDSRRAAKYIHLDAALRAGDYPGGHRIELSGEEG